MKKSIISLLVFIVLSVYMLMFYHIGQIHPLVFMWYICVLYVVSLPRNLLSPKNIIFAYYFLWYALAPSFATRFQNYSFRSQEEMISYLMLFFVYGVSIVTLTFCEEYFNNKNKISNVTEGDDTSKNLEVNKLKRISIWSLVLVVISLFLFINKTGGISRWIIDSGMAFISRGGSGGVYLLFLHSLMLFMFSYGILVYLKVKNANFIKPLILIIVLFPFIGSKAQVILLVFIGLGNFLIRQNLVSKWTFRAVLIAVFFFTIGIIQRNYTWMAANDFIPYTLNYFNTYEMLVISVKDFDPSFFKTVFLPLNWILQRFGTYIHVPFHDMSIWLTSIYYPQDWAVSATQQWPIETDLYLSFNFVLGLPFLMLYLVFLSYAFNKAKMGYASWTLIYIIEFVYIISHYRGGLVNYWYFWLIPFYILVIMMFKKIRLT